MIRGAVLIKAGASEAPKIAQEAKKIEGIIDAFLVFGRFDIVALMEAKDFESLRDVAAKITRLPGVKSTETLPEAR
jgi:DNA-binding Lrp family transcriptional regulator